MYDVSVVKACLKDYTPLTALTLFTGTIESAAVYSLMAAGAAHELAAACRTGAVSNCKCEIVGDVRTQDAQGNIIFNDCSDNTGYATDIMNQFIKNNSTNMTDLDVVNNHNYQVGLKVRERDNTVFCVQQNYGGRIMVVGGCDGRIMVVGGCDGRIRVVGGCDGTCRVLNLNQPLVSPTPLLLV